ncbi:MAG: hypothetical protein HY235_23220 [Acidobacteria bacterium]|nr:hypothetical protein [Acidobacteriota bacterium]
MAFRFAGLLLLGVALNLPAQSEREFAIPISDLRNWADRAVIRVANVEITGNSKVHAMANDCELHFGAKMPAFQGDPDGVVLEPMNVCVEPFFGKSKYSKADWENWANGLGGKKVTVTGVPRIWPEHLEGSESPSNPNHAVEIHPLTRIEEASKQRDFRRFIFAPEGYEGGVKEATARTILHKTVVEVAKENDSAVIRFQGGRIGNFTTLDIRFRRDGIVKVEGGHQIAGEALFDEADPVPVYLLSIDGSEVDSHVARFKASRSRRQQMRFSALVLFSLSPKALVAALDAGRQRVERPIQLILYGEAENHQ